MFLDPTKLSEATPEELLDSAAKGHIGLDRRFLRALVDRKDEALPVVLAFTGRDRSDDAVDLVPELVALLRHWKSPEALPFFIHLIEEDPEEIPDELLEAVVHIGKDALEPLLALYSRLEEGSSGEVAFMLANLHIRDERILNLLIERTEFDLPDALFLLGLYGDPAAQPKIEDILSELGDSDQDIKKEANEALAEIRKSSTTNSGGHVEGAFDVFASYPEEAELPIDLLDEDERGDLLKHPVSAVRATAANSFFNREMTPEIRQTLLRLAESDTSAEVRARSWEALMDATENSEVVEAMLTALRKTDLPVEERGGLLVGLAPEADRNEVRKAVVEFYDVPGGRAKALESMWRSVHPSFRDYFPKHLEDTDLEVRRGAVWGVGYYSIKTEIGNLRKLFDHEELRSDALFAYALALPAEVSRGRMKGILNRIEKDANGLSEMEEQLVKAALDERLVMAGKEPFFAGQED